MRKLEVRSAHVDPIDRDLSAWHLKLKWNHSPLRGSGIEDFVACLELAIERITEKVLVILQGPVEDLQLNGSLRMRHRQRFEHERVEQRENRGVNPDSQRQREERDESESWCAPKTAIPKMEIAGKLLEALKAAVLPILFLDLL